MIIAYLLYSQFFSDPEHAKRYYASMRTYNRKGLTIPSQIRFVEYFYASLKNRALVESETPPTLVLLGIKIVPPPFVDRLELLRFTVHCNQQLIYDHDQRIKVDQQMIQSSNRVAHAAIQASQPTKSKLLKSQQCSSCTKLHATKENVWVICSLCGHDTCVLCTKKQTVDTGGALLDGHVQRLVCKKCLDGGLEDSPNVVRGLESRFMDDFNTDVDAGSDEFAITLEPGKVVPVKGDVKVSIYHRGPKPLIHFWINTRFHSRFPIVLTKQHIDGAHKDPECKLFPPDFRLIVSMRPAESGEQMIPMTTPAGAGADPKNKATTTASGFSIEPNGATVFNKASGGAIKFGIDVSVELARNAISVLSSFAAEKKGDSEGAMVSKEAAQEMANSLDYQALLGRLGALNMVNLSEAAADELVAFWLNVYHLLLILSIVEMYPSTPKQRVRNGRACHLHVAGERLSLFEIEFGVLRSAHVMPSIPQALLGTYTPRRHRFGDFYEDSEALPKIVTFGMSYLCAGTPSVQAYTIGSGVSTFDQVLANGARYLQLSGIVINSAKQLVSISSYLEWFQSESDVQNIQLAVSNWLQVFGPWFDASLTMEMKNHETFKFKFEDNVMLDQVQMFCLEENAKELQSGVHRAPTLPELPASQGNDNNITAL